MKYMKSSAEIIRFDLMDIFMAVSGVPEGAQLFHTANGGTYYCADIRWGGTIEGGYPWVHCHEVYSSTGSAATPNLPDEGGNYNSGYSCTDFN